jgi:hypothetical protein
MTNGGARSTQVKVVIDPRRRHRRLSVQVRFIFSSFLFKLKKSPEYYIKKMMMTKIKTNINLNNCSI